MVEPSIPTISPFAEIRHPKKRAFLTAGDALEGEAWRRAVEGVEEPVGWYKGESGGVVRRYSDTLLIVLMRGLMPERYGNRVEVRGSLANLDVSKLPDHLVARIAAGEHPMAVLAREALNKTGVVSWHETTGEL